MKVTFSILALCILVLFSCNPSEDFESICLSDGLKAGVIAFYPFNDGSLADESSFSNDLTNTTSASPTIDRNGNMNCAYSFDNLNQQKEFLTTTDSKFLNKLDVFSISLWYLPIDSINPGDIQGLFSRDSIPQCDGKVGEWSMSLYDCNQAVFSYDNAVWNIPTTVNGSGVSNYCELIIEETINDWQHVVGVKNKEEYKLYFNGELHSTANGITSCTDYQLAQDKGDVFVGFDFSGNIDDILIYDRELSANEVEELYELGSCCE